MVRDLMNRRLITVEPHSTVAEAAKKMLDEDVGCVVILDNGKARGILTDRDIVTRCVAKKIDVDDCTVENVMTESLSTVRETDGLFECIEIMNGSRARRIPVINDSSDVVGIISFGDILAVLGKELHELTRPLTPSIVQEIVLPEKIA